MVFCSKQYNLKLTGKNYYTRVIVQFGIENMVSDVWIDFW